MSFNDIISPINLFLATVALANALIGSFFYFIWRSLKKSVQKELMEKIDAKHEIVTKTLAEQDKSVIRVVTKLDAMAQSQTSIQEGITKTCTQVENLAKGLSDHIQESIKDRTDLRARIEVLGHDIANLPKHRISLKKRTRK